MNSKHTSEEKRNVIAAYKSGKSVSLLVTETGIPRSTIYAWLANKRAESSEKETIFTLRDYRNLENKVDRLKGIIDILQKAPCTATAPLENRLHEQRQPQLPLLFHTDRGSNYRSNAFCTYWQSLGVTQSFSRAHVPYDNSVMESFFASMKREELYRTKYRSEQELRAAIAEYIKFYNETRPHAKNGYKTPAKKEQEYYANSKRNEER